MPNYCENKLTVRGTKEQIEKFKQKYCTVKNIEYSNCTMLCLDFNKVIPEPETIDECPEKYIIHNKEEAAARFLGWDENDPKRWFDWYNWRISNWGTKWIGIPNASEETTKSLKLYFDTAWAPPSGVVERLILDNYNLKISCHYEEPGMGFSGTISYKQYENPNEKIIKEDK